MVIPSQVFINNDPQKFRWSSLNYGYFIDIKGLDGAKLFLSEENIMKLVFSKLTFQSNVTKTDFLV